MKSHICSIAVFVAIIATGLTIMPRETVVRHSFLHRLTIPEDSLPDGCEIQEISPDTLPVKNLKNRSVTTHTQEIFIGDERLEELIDAENVEVMYLAVYQEREKNELGIFGWAFRSTKSAREAHEKLTASYANEPARVRFWLWEKYVVWLWRDPGVSHSCFNSFSTHIQRIVAKAAGERPAEIPPRKPTPIVELPDYDVLGQCFSFHAGTIVIHDEGKKVPGEIDLVHWGGKLYANHYGNGFGFSGKGGIVGLGKNRIDGIKEAPREGYTYSIQWEDLIPGHLYCVRTGSGKQYGVIRVVSVQQRPKVLRFEWQYPVPVAKREWASRDKKAGTPKIILHAGKQEDADSALAVFTRFLDHWEADEYENASGLVIENLRKKFAEYLQRRPIELKSIDSITLSQGRDSLRARVHISLVPRGGIGMDMEFQNGKWWITGD